MCDHRHDSSCLTASTQPSSLTWMSLAVRSVPESKWNMKQTLWPGSLTFSLVRSSLARGQKLLKHIKCKFLCICLHSCCITNFVSICTLVSSWLLNTKQNKTLCTQCPKKSEKCSHNYQAYWHILTYCQRNGQTNTASYSTKSQFRSWVILVLGLETCKALKTNPISLECGAFPFSKFCVVAVVSVSTFLWSPALSPSAPCCAAALATDSWKSSQTRRHAHYENISYLVRAATV